MKRIAIVGGGISGLAAAFALEERRRAGEALEYVVYESGPRFGGVLLTEQVQGCLVEAGPDSFLTEKPWAADLCRRLGIEDQLIGSNDGDRKTYILVKGKLVPMPDGLMFMVPTQACAGVVDSAFFRRHKVARGARMVVPRAAVEWRRKCGSAGGAPLRRGNGRSSGRPAACRRLWRRSRATQRARGAAAFRRNGVEVRQPGAGDAGSSQEPVKRSSRRSNFLLSQRGNAATRGGIGGQASARRRCGQTLPYRPCRGRIEAG